MHCSLLGLHSRQHARCTFNDRSIDRTLQASLILTRSTCQACTSRRSSVVRRTRNVSSDARCRRQVSRNVHQRILSLVYPVSSVPSGIVWNARLHSSAIGLVWFGLVWFGLVWLSAVVQRQAEVRCGYGARENREACGPRVRRWRVRSEHPIGVRLPHVSTQSTPCATQSTRCGP
jgi:hypothetical protein